MMINVLKAPNRTIKEDFDEMIFLAGGISNCPDWQKDFITKARSLKSIHTFLLIDPRRDNFDTSKKEMSEEQIEWEYNFLRESDKIVFWFPKETLCPITLFELGAALERNQEIHIGCHPDYQRLFDVTFQARLKNPNIRVVHSIDDLVEQTFQY